MAAATRRSPFVTKPTEQLLETAEGTSLNRAVGSLDLTALGIGAIIGTGIFVIIGEAIALSGPALVISFVLAGRDLHLLGARLRRARLRDPGLGLGLHIRLRDDGRSCWPGSSAGT